MPSLALTGPRVILAGMVVLVATSSCGFPGTGPDAEDAVKDLAKALSADSLDAVPVAGDTAEARRQYAEVTQGLAAGLGQGPDQKNGVSVSPGEVTSDGDNATGVLEWRRKVGGATWRYTTKVALTTRGADEQEGWLVRWKPTILEPSLEPGEKLVVRGSEPTRGRILGAADKPIVTPRPVLRVGLDKTEIERAQLAGAATALARLLEVDGAAFSKRVAAAGPKAFVEAIVYRPAEVPAGVERGLVGIPGARSVPDRLPLAPTKDFASAILGTVGPATAELVEQSNGRIEPGQDVGISGLQKRYDEQLSGSRGAKVLAVGGQGAGRTLFTADPEDGEDLLTTIDPEAQRLAQELLAEVGPASAVVALRPSSGELVAAASGPGSRGYNTATLGRYPPGSTFKVVTALALLRSGVRPQTQVLCPATTVVDGKRFKNYADYPASGSGRITFADAVAISCNTAFILQRDQLDKDSVEQAAAALGVGVDHDLGFPAFFGSVGRPASQTQAAAEMIGQGAVLASPMAMATTVASVMKGSAVVPRLLPKHELEPKGPTHPLKAAEAEQLQTLMRGVVTRGSGRLLAGLPGGPVIAKTGTAEFGDQPPLPTHAWMVAGQDDLAVAVFVERGDSGSGTAGPILRRFLREVRLP